MRKRTEVLRWLLMAAAGLVLVAGCDDDTGSGSSDAAADVVSDGSDAASDASDASPDSGDGGDADPLDTGDADGGATCGNGTVDDGEDCEPDGAGGCTSDCQFTCATNVDCLDVDVCNGQETCGDVADGRACSAAPAAAAAGTPCPADTASLCDGDGACVASSCGDGLVDPRRAESCEPDDEGCAADCQLESCGDGGLDAGEQCDDGNDLRFDGCDRCLYEGALRTHQLALSGDAPPSFCELGANAVGEAIAPAVITLLNSVLAENLTEGDLALLVDIRGASDLTGATAQDLILAPYGGTAYEIDDADEWVGGDLVDAPMLALLASLDAELRPRTALAGRAEDGVVTAGPSSVEVLLPFLGGPRVSRFDGVQLRATLAESTSAPAVPDQLVSDVVERADGTGEGGLCGAIPVPVAARLPIIPELAEGGEFACGCEGSPSYPPCPGLVDDTCASLLDVLVSGCRIQLGASCIDAVTPTQPDLLRGGPALVAGADGHVPFEQTVLHPGAYTAYMTFEAVRANVVGVAGRDICASPVACEVGFSQDDACDSQAMTGPQAGYDEFSGEAVDDGLWTVHTTDGEPSSAATLVEGGLELANRAYIVADGSDWDPNVAGPVRLSGTWTYEEWGDATDALVLTTRSAFDPNPEDGGTMRSGALCLYEASGRITLVGRGLDRHWVERAQIAPPAVGDTIAFEMVDDGRGVLCRIRRLNDGQFGAALVDLEGRPSPASSVVVHNVAVDDTGDYRGVLHTLSVEAGVVPPLAEWTFDQDPVGLVRDRVGGADGVQGPETSYGPGYIGQGLSFSGEGGQSVTLSAEVPALQGTRDFTVAWRMRAETGDATTWIANADADQVFGGLTIGLDATGHPTAALDGSAGDGEVSLTASAAVTDGEWHHVAVVRAGAELRLYVDGTAAGSATAADEQVAWAGPDAALTLGGGPAAAATGDLDELRLYDRPLAACEVARLARPRP